jgi:pyridoxamine 5'-phosphate oxidase
MYSRSLNENDIAPSPITQFQNWFDEALQANLPDVNAMTLATATVQGKVSARIVLLKSFDKRGFCFYTNYDSRKGKELAQNPGAALVFFWQSLERQVRVEGVVVRLSDEESNEYFHSRPFGSQIGAIASPQSREIPDRETLEAAYASLEEKYMNQIVPRPGHWGGYRLVPERVEFWQGRENRLHDRIVYTREGGGWKRARLAP